ncbi:MAG: hypothetical protein AB7N76_11325 [Planctomycetota bacterium]
MSGPAPTDPAQIALAPTDPCAALALHVLAHVPLAGPEDLYDLAWVQAWAARARPERRAALAEEAAILAARWPLEPRAALLQGLPGLLGDLAALERLAPRSLRSLRADEVRDPALLRALQTLDEPLIELLWASLGLEAEAWAARWPELERELSAACAALDPWLREAASLAPPLRAARVELAPSLGPRGRGFADRLIVGAALPWNDLTPPEPAVQAAHEALVRAEPAQWATSEWRALTGLSAALRTASPALRAAHTRWLARLDLRALCREVGGGALELLTLAPAARPEWFAARPWAR